MFLSFCLHYAGISEEVMPQESGVRRWADLLRDEEHSQHDAVAVPIIIRHIEDAGVQKPIDEAGFLSGNGTGQWGSHAIVMQAWITQYLTSESEKEGTKS